MKILILFCDMLRANLLRTFNSSIEQDGPMDQWFRRLGGTMYTNCYTPAPDTPRSMACFFTGRYPKHNGCYSRLQWPKYYLKANAKTFFDLFLENNYHLVMRVADTLERVGLLPLNITNENPSIDIFHALSSTVSELENRWSTADKLLGFISLPDYHMAMDDYGHNSWGDLFGQQHLANACRMVFNTFQPDDFDYILVFSDHGCKLHEELAREGPLLLLNDDRSKIVMLLRQKGDKTLQHCHDHTSIMDVLPTFRDILHISQNPCVDGCSLFSPQADRFIVLEDHLGFPPKIGAIHELWGVRDTKFFYLESLSDKVLLNISNDEQGTVVKDIDLAMVRQYQTKIATFACSYTDNKKQHKILEYYRAMKVDKDYYSDGEKRLTRGLSLLIKVKNRFFSRRYKNRYRRWP